MKIPPPFPRISKILLFHVPAIFLTFLLGSLQLQALADSDPERPASKETLQEKKDPSSQLEIDYPDRRDLKKIINLGLSAEHDQALRLAATYNEKHKDHACGYFVEGLVKEWLIEPQIPEPSLKPAIDAFEKAGHLKPQSRESALDASSAMCRGAALMHLARIYYKYGETIKGVRRGIAGARQLERTAQLAPHDSDLYAFLGAYHYFTARAPKTARWVMRLFGLKGNRFLGLKELNTAWTQGDLFKDTAGHILYVVLFKYEKKYQESQKILHDLLQKYPYNLVFQRLDAEAKEIYAASSKDKTP